MKRWLWIGLLLPAVVSADSETTPKLYFCDVASAPAGAPVCCFGRNFPTEANAVLKLDGASGNCTVNDSGGDTTFLAYSQSAQPYGTATGRACFLMPASAGDCTDTFSTIILNDGTTDSNSQPMARHTGNILWVRTDGAGSSCNADTSGGACDTIAEANSAATIGDVIVVRAGTYTTTSADITKNGSASRPVSLIGYPAAYPTLQQTADVTGEALNVQSEWVQVAGLALTSADVDHEIKTVQWDGPDGRIVNTWHHDNTASCLKINPTADRLRVFGNDFDNCAELTNNPISGDPPGHGIYHEEAQDTVISYNRMFDNGGWGMQVFNSAPVGIAIGITISHNESFDNAIGASQSSGGITLNTTQDVRVFNNLVYGNAGAGININGTNTGLLVYNNTLFDMGAAEIKIRNNTTATIRNNILNDSGTCVDNTSTGTVTFSHNLFSTCAGTGSNNVTSPPLFTNSAADDFSLQSGSPARDAGTSPPGARTLDFENNSAPLGSAHDIGAYEFASPATPAVCGNNIKEGAEVCDGSDLNSQTCELQGFACGDTLFCNAGCTAFVTTNCVASASCGNGAIDTIGTCNEVCDGALLGGATCENQGFGACGALTCHANCLSYVTTACDATCARIIGGVTLNGVRIN